MRVRADALLSPMTSSSLLRAEEGLPRGVQGAADPRFANVIRIFAGLFPGRRFGGGALSVYIDGKPVVDVWTGWSDRDGEVPWAANTGAMVFSATKGVAATVVHRLVDRGLLAYDTPVAEYWPEFGANGKSDITVRDVLRHRSGLSHLKGVTKEDLLDHLLMEQRLAAAPADHLRGWPAYHALTYGWLVSGLCRAVTGMGMRDLIRDELARPLNTDGLHLGRPPAGSPTKVAQILAPQSARPNPVFNFVAPKVAGLPFSGALGSMYLPGIKSLVQGDIPFLDGEVPAANGVVTGRGLARMYAAIANGGVIDGERVPVTGTRGRSDRQAEGVARFEPRGADAVPSRLSRIAHSRAAEGLRPHRSRRNTRLGRSVHRQRLRLCPQPAADADGVRYGFVRGVGEARFAMPSPPRAATAPCRCRGTERRIMTLLTRTAHGRSEWRADARLSSGWKLECRRRFRQHAFVNPRSRILR